MRKRREGLCVWSCRLRQCKGIFAGLYPGREQARRITPNQGREAERGKGGGRSLGVGSQRTGLSESLLASGCVSHFTSSLAVARAQMRRQEGGRGRYPESFLSLFLCVCFFTKKTQLGLKLKQCKTCKSSRVSCPPSFSQFPV